MKTNDFDYYLPEELIAQSPLEPRDHSRFLVYNRATKSIAHKHFYDLPEYLDQGDVLVLNNTRVIPARLLGEKEDTAVPVEILLLKRLNITRWEAIVKPGRRLKPGSICSFGNGKLRARIAEILPDGGRIVEFLFQGIFEEILDELGQMPLPPYIHEKLEDKERYQTVYAKHDGSAAAPTAGLHFTPQLLQKLQAKGVRIVPVLLHVGLGTFRPVKAEELSDHSMHSEYCEISQEACDIINEARKTGKKCICVGTTSVRTLESCAKNGLAYPIKKDTNIFIHPGYQFHLVDGLITNFHLPKSTLLMLISALMGREEALRVYGVAVKKKYRFFSFGDSMFVR